jgi:hypothetical protein
LIQLWQLIFFVNLLRQSKERDGVDGLLKKIDFTGFIGISLENSTPPSTRVWVCRCSGSIFMCGQANKKGTLSNRVPLLFMVYTVVNG